jgi:hypothetical protein
MTMTNSRGLRLEKGVLFFERADFSLATPAINFETVAQSRVRVSFQLQSEVSSRLEEQWLKASMGSSVAERTSEKSGGGISNYLEEFGNTEYSAYGKLGYPVVPAYEASESFYRSRFDGLYPFSIQYLSDSYQSSYRSSYTELFHSSVEYLSDYRDSYQRASLHASGYFVSADLYRAAQLHTATYGARKLFGWERDQQSCKLATRMSATLVGYDSDRNRIVISLSDLEGCETIEASKGRVQVTFVLAGDGSGYDPVKIICGRRQE